VRNLHCGAGFSLNVGSFGKKPACLTRATGWDYYIHAVCLATKMESTLLKATNFTKANHVRSKHDAQSLKVEKKGEKHNKGVVNGSRYT
jgi:hypothetical protein